MDFNTTVLQKSAGYWVALCLENGLVGQGRNQEAAIKQLKRSPLFWKSIKSNLIFTILHSL